MLTQKYYSEGNFFYLDYPRTWEMEIHDHIPAFFDPISGNGALQILAVDIFPAMNDEEKKTGMIKAYPYLAGEKLIDKMVIFLHMQDIRINPNDLKIYARKGTYFIPHEYSVQGRFYMSVMMEKCGILLLAIYNAASKPDKMEADIIGEILKSIEITERKN